MAGLRPGHPRFYIFRRGCPAQGPGMTSSRSRFRYNMRMESVGMRIRHVLVVALAALAPAAPLSAQSDYPNRPIQLVVTVPPGGAADFFARIIGPRLADALGQPVVINNRAGAGGTVAAASVA